MSILRFHTACHSSQNCLSSSIPRDTVSAPSIFLATSEYHSISGWTAFSQASMSPRFQPSRHVRTASTFCWDIVAQYPAAQPPAAAMREIGRWASKRASTTSA